MHDFDKLIEIIETLSGEGGCPWDKAQTHESIRACAIEEAYEVVDAIDRGDRGAMIEELGDMMLQTLFHADIARRAGTFDINDIITALCNKLISRHPHVFSDASAKSPEQGIGLWEKQKELEKGGTSLKDKLKALPADFPALHRAVKVFKKINKTDAERQPYTEAELERDLIALTKRAAAAGLHPELTLNKAITRIIDEQPT